MGPAQKITDRIDLHVPEQMKRDLQDMALRQDRKVSDLCRHIIACWMYGHQGSCMQDSSPDANRGE